MNSKPILYPIAACVARLRELYSTEVRSPNTSCDNISAVITHKHQSQHSISELLTIIQMANALGLGMSNPLIILNPNYTTNTTMGLKTMPDTSASGTTYTKNVL